MNILHIINDLGRGGAETALLRFAEQSQKLGDSVSVICLRDEGELGSWLRQLGIPVMSIGLRFGPGLPGSLIRLGQLIRQAHPDVVQTWLYHSNLIGGVVSRVASPKSPVVWGIHHSILKAGSSRRTTILVSRLSALVSRIVPKHIVYCANVSRISHEAAGYAAGKGSVIVNGISLEMFRPDVETRRRVRDELQVDESIRLIGIVARYHPDKDIHTFVAAAGTLAVEIEDVRFMLVGKGLDAANVALIDAIMATGFPDRFILLGPRNDVPDVLTAFDIAALSSVTEAFPISIIEAMAVGLPFVSTDVGDAAEAIGITGRIVPVADPVAMAAAWRELLSMSAEQLARMGHAARERVEANYQLVRTTEAYRAVYRSLISA